jgi:hypothetical protein
MEAPNPNSADVTRHSERLIDGRRFIRYVHEPTGIFADGFVEKEESIAKANERLWQELVEKMSATQS